MIERTEYFRTSLFYLSVNAAQTWYLKTTEICALTVLVPEVKNQGVCMAMLPPKSLRENPSLFVPALGYAEHMTASVHCQPLFSLAFFPRA